MTKQYVDSQEFCITLPKPATKQYEPKDYAHVLKALAEGKPIYYEFQEKPVPTEAALKSVALGQLDPLRFLTEKPRPEIAIDTPVWVKCMGTWAPRHFAGYNAQGMPTYWVNGVTSHSVPDDRFVQKYACDEISLNKPEGAK